ncbi:MAG: class I SAM-dependent methyltransferase [Melioribacteraceae bacterium]|nr:class I SAM-dependent methyltransferase [Melioribacteraceae bacterium]
MISIKMKFSSSLLRWKDVFKRIAGEGIYPHELSFLLDSPIRKLILSPKKLVDRLHVSNNSKVLEIGSGPGYFSIEVAKRIPDGFLVLFDIQYEMLKKVSMKLERERIKNAIAIQGNAIILPFNIGVFDIVFLVTVLGEVEDPNICLHSIYKVLRVGGILSITEMEGDPDALSQDEINQLVVNNGFVFLEKHPSFKGFTVNYKKISQCSG